jgi:hypothetical protein
MRQLFLQIFIILFFSLICEAQSEKSSLPESGGHKIDSIFTIDDLSADSLIHINLLEVEIIQPYKFKNSREERKYGRLVEDIIKAYPLSIIVGSELTRVNAELKDVYTDKARRKKYIKWYEDYVYDTYIDSLKTLNMRQGRLLLKLIDRETGQSPYKLIKEYRGGGKAFVWRTMALFFGANLNARYDKEDEIMLEHIIKRYEAGDFEVYENVEQ